jgi:hypothetical protein
VKNQWNKKKRKKPFRSSKRNRPDVSRIGALAGGGGMAADSDLLSILEIMLMDIVDQGGTIFMNVEDGRLSISGEISGMILCDVSGKEAKQ